MTNPRVLVGLACAMVLAATSAHAQDGAEVTPYIFMGSNSASGLGAAVRWPLTAQLSVEFETAYRRAEIGAVSSNVSLLFDLPKIGSVTPYVAGGIGLDQYGTAEDVAGRVVAFEKTAFSVNAGGGIRVQADQKWGIRTDARWFNDIGRGPERWRLYNGLTLGGRR